MIAWATFIGGAVFLTIMQMMFSQRSNSLIAFTMEYLVTHDRFERVGDPVCDNDNDNDAARPPESTVP